jgi:hypothetical protein
MALIQIHYNINLPTKSTILLPMSKNYCLVCEDPNATHRPRDCPKGIDLYHGTRVSNLASIVNGGLHPSASGRIGPGIYFAS